MRIALVLIVVVTAMVAGFFWLNRPQLVPVTGSLPANFPDDGFSHRDFERLLQTFVNDAGDVDYDRWHASQESVDGLRSYLVAVSTYSPETTPERFPSRQDELAYWMYGYNGYVIFSVLDNWPLESVTDLKAPIEAVQGLGFFYRLRFTFGGKPYSLLTVENDWIRKQFRDPRIHFVLNCGSESCPVLRPELPTGAELERLLSDATTDFVSDPRNVSIDHQNRVIRLSAIFKMYDEDFINHLRAGGKPVDRGVLAYVQSVAPPDLRESLTEAATYKVEFDGFDWGVNSAGH